MPAVADTHPLRPTHACSANADAGDPAHRATAVIAESGLLLDLDNG